MPITILLDRTAGIDGAAEKSAAPSASAPLLDLELRPHQSLTPKGFVWFIGLTSGLFLIPLIAIVGTAALWFVLVFVVADLALVWLMINRSWTDGTLSERVTLTADRLAIHRTNPRKADQTWEANPYWVRMALHPKPVENYLTLKGHDREVELGRFLSPAERLTLHGQLSKALSAAKT